MGSLAPAVAAVLGGLVVVVVALVPWAALQYRRRGALGVGTAAIAVATVVYALAIVTFTLIPLPADPAAMCVAGGSRPQLDVLAFVTDIRREGGISGPVSILRNRAVAQIVFNVVLFVPLGMIVRHVFLRGQRVSGILVGTAAGFAVSLLIEFTQLTGDWFLYPCAYRLFDVDDLLANTLGALLGAFLSPLLRLVPGQLQRLGAETARPITALRRFFGMFCDLIAVTVVQAGLAISFSLAVAVADRSAREGWAMAMSLGLALVPALGQLVLVWMTGRTLGDLVVRLRPTRRPSLLRGAIRWALGIGGWSVLVTVPSSLADLVAAALAVAAVIGVWSTRGRRGFPYAVSGLDVEDDREALPTSP